MKDFGLEDVWDVASVGPGSSGPLSRRSFAEITPRAVQWLSPGVIPLRTSTLVAGQGGLGKSTYLLGKAATLTREKPPASVIVMSYEDTAAEILRPRLEAAEAVLSHVFEILVAPEEGGALMLPRDFDRLEDEVEETRARLVIIDPVLAAIDVSLDAHKDQHVRIVLARLAALAERQACAVVLVLHLNKAPSKDPYLRISSSTGFYNAARSVVLVVPDPEEPEHHRLVAQTKANWARRSPVERHVLEEIVLDHLDPETGEPIVTSRMRFVECVEGIDRDAILGAERGERSGERTGEAIGFLREALAGEEWHRSHGVKEAAAGAGIVERTLQRAVEHLGVESERRGFPSETWWRLPQSRQPLSTTPGATVSTASINASEPVHTPVAPGGAGRGNGATEAVDCLICDAPFDPNANGSAPLTCPDCIERRTATWNEGTA